MVNNFFDLVKDAFFYPFTNRNKRYNYDLLQLINSKMSLDNLQVPKEEIVEWIIDYIDNCPIEMFNDENNNSVTDIKSFAYEKVRYFVKCGWLIEDFDSMKITYQMDENGIKLLAVMENSIKEDTRSLEFSGYVYNIYNNLYHFQIDHSVGIVEQVYSASKQLNSMLRGLNVNIKKFLTKLISENEATPKEILETIFFEYQKKVVLKAFKNFREKDNPSKYKLYIENKIDDLLGEKLDYLINNYIKVKHDGVSSSENYKEAKEFFESKLIYIKDQFEEIEEYIQILDKRNTKYITTAQSRLNFLLNEETDIEGRIINCLKGIENSNDNFFEESFFDIFLGANIDEYSLYKPFKRKNKPKLDPIIDEFNDDPQDIKKMTEILFKNNMYSVNEINKFVLTNLEDKKQIHAKDIKINEFNDILKIFLIQIYSANTSINYKIIYLNDKYESLGYKMTNFIIEKETK